MTDTTEIPNDKLAKLLISEAKLDCDMDIHAPEEITDPEPWEWLDTMSVTDVEADMDNYEHVIVHGETETGYHKKAMSATRTNPAAYEYVKCTVDVGIWWDLDPETQPELSFEVYEQ